MWIGGVFEARARQERYAFKHQVLWIIRPRQPSQPETQSPLLMGRAP
ncbi:hypothetical protein B0I32_102194 [Nonomuraea fuscirosea]|uniref:Uncharacterized protein n=1 Tax=Nonomuraea fuscirosea TaxID=1291556 RepID=A0A2T0N8N3_9ACTN|nr:hypothetical protein B0I32_102194 [Nonomuraea fuscirosea]